jgi:hypothetical protein
MVQRKTGTLAARIVGAALFIVGLGGTAAFADDPAAGTTYAPDYAQWCQDKSWPADRCANPTAEDKAQFAEYLDKREEMVSKRDASRRLDYDFKQNQERHADPFRPPEH